MQKRRTIFRMPRARHDNGPPALVWFRRDMRLADHPALVEAVGLGGPVIPVFVWSPEEEAPWAPGACSRAWLHDSLKQLDRSLRRLGSRLIIRRGPSWTMVESLARETGAGTVLWNRLYEPAAHARDKNVERRCREAGLSVRHLNATLLVEPWEVCTRQGGPFRAFSRFWEACRQLRDVPEPLPAPTGLPSPSRWPETLRVEDLGLRTTTDWPGPVGAGWSPGEEGAHCRLRRLLDDVLAGYGMNRDRPDVCGTSRLSPHLHFGEIGPRQVWHTVQALVGPGASGRLESAGDKFMSELGWREFAYHVLHHFPETPEKPLQAKFARLPWDMDDAALHAWQRGNTGYPMVDAGMRELRSTGWMHNRARMNTASFLTKDLLMPWQEGARWFWDRLVDADLANNTLGWQWTAGCGADAAPYFRVFNPVRQGERFDPNGEYVRQWVPELAELPARWIHKPWQAPAAVLAKAGIRLGKDYPRPIVDHDAARARALSVFATLNQQGKI